MDEIDELNYKNSGVPVNKIKFQDKIFVKFLDNFRTFSANKGLNLLCDASV